VFVATIAAVRIAIAIGVGVDDACGIDEAGGVVRNSVAIAAAFDDSIGVGSVDAVDEGVAATGVGIGIATAGGVAIGGVGIVGVAASNGVGGVGVEAVAVADVGVGVGFVVGDAIVAGGGVSRANGQGGWFHVAARATLLAKAMVMVLGKGGKEAGKWEDGILMQICNGIENGRSAHAV